MTGYGKAVETFQGKKIVAEVKSLNSKALDMQSRICSQYREKEMPLRAEIGKVLERGKVDFNLWIEKDEGVGDSPFNAPALGEYYRQLQQICREQGIPEPENPWSTLMRLPDAMTRMETQAAVSDEEWQTVHRVVKSAVGQLVHFREQEGNALEGKFRQNIERIGDLLQQVEPYEKARVEKIRQRITEGLQGIPNVEYDRNRLEQEMIYYIERLDISEEKQRLTNHLHYFIETMETGHGQGKKLGFIAQEMGREINTLGSKSNQAEMQNLVVMMKDELEQIKEQVLNVM